MNSSYQFLFVKMISLSNLKICKYFEKLREKILNKGFSEKRVRSDPIIGSVCVWLGGRWRFQSLVRGLTEPWASSTRAGMQAQLRLISKSTFFEGKEKERERNINVQLPLAGLSLETQPATQACALTGNRTSNPLVCRPALNPLSHTSRGSLQLALVPFKGICRSNRKVTPNYSLCLIVDCL